MKGLLLGTAIAISVGGVAFAGETKKSGGEAGRGGLAEWPVSKEEANWKSAAPSAASSGTSSTPAPAGTASTGGATPKMDLKETSDRTPEKKTDTPLEQKDAPGGKTSDRTPKH